MESAPPNPYSAPSSNPYGGGGDAAGSVSPSTISALAGTKPWVRFISVMFWIGAGMMMLLAAGMGVMGAIGGPIEEAVNKSGALGGAPLIIIAAVYGVMALFYIYPAVKLWAYGTRIGSLSTTMSVADLDSALHEQRRFWKYVGILMIVMICAYLVLIIGMVAFAGMEAVKQAGA
ncbi:MAG: DUF5362 family protein [Prosthecobacter sp.]